MPIACRVQELHTTNQPPQTKSMKHSWLYGSIAPNLIRLSQYFYVESSDTSISTEATSSILKILVRQLPGLPGLFRRPCHKQNHAAKFRIYQAGSSASTPMLQQWSPSTGKKEMSYRHIKPLWLEALGGIGLRMAPLWISLLAEEYILKLYNFWKSTGLSIPPHSWPSFAPIERWQIISMRIVHCIPTGPCQISRCRSWVKGGKAMLKALRKL